MSSSASSFDLIDLSSPISEDFSSILSPSRRGTSFASIAEEPEQESATQDFPEEEEPSITEHHGVSLRLDCSLGRNTKEYATYADFQFNRYHQSQFRMKGKSRTIKDGWWAGSLEGEVNGQKSLMLRYEGDRKSAMKVNHIHHDIS